MTDPKQPLLAMRAKLSPVAVADLSELHWLDQALERLDMPTRGHDAWIAGALRFPASIPAYDVPAFTSSIEAAFGAAFALAPGWVFLSLAQDVTPQRVAGDLVKPTGKWFAKWQRPAGGLLQIGAARLPTTAIVRGAIACRLTLPEGISA